MAVVCLTSVSSAGNSLQRPHVLFKSGEQDLFVHPFFSRIKAVINRNNIESLQLGGMTGLAFLSVDTSNSLPGGHL